MNYYSAKEAAKRWGISSRRITKLASEGRIEGAVLVGSTWMIPDDAKKPLDGRKKENPIEYIEEKYHFPALLYEINSSTIIEMEFTKEEQTLYHASLKYEEGKFEECIELFEGLLETSSNDYIQFGARYMLFYCYRSIGEFEKALEQVPKMRLIALSAKEHNEELVVLLREVEGSYEGFRWQEESLLPYINTVHSKGFSAFLAIASVTMAIQDTVIDAEKFDITNHEITCRLLEMQGYSYASAIYHMGLATAYGLLKNSEMTLSHFKKSIDTCVKHGYYEYVGIMLASVPRNMELIEEYYPKEVYDRFSFWMNLYYTQQAGLIECAGGPSVFRSLTLEEYKYISYTISGYSVAHIAKIENKSQYAVKKIYSAIQSKLNVVTKKDLINLFLYHKK